MQNVSAPDCPTSNHGNEGFGARANLPLKIQNIQSLDATFVRVTSITTNLLVSTGTKSQFPFPSQNHDPDGGVVAGILKGLSHFMDGERSKCIAALGTVDGDFCDALRFFIADIFKFQCGFPLKSHLHS